MALQVVWFKRDLRVHDHAALVAACAANGPVLPVYVFEPELWALPEHSARQFGFLIECLSELDAALWSRGARLHLAVGEACDVFTRLHVRHGLAAIHAHEETGLQWTFDRDIAVRAWARRAGVPFREYSQHGVIRGLRARDGWARRWNDRMSGPRLKAPNAIGAAEIPGDGWPRGAELGITSDACPQRQRGGRAAGVELLQSFLEDRGRTYRTAMSSPVSAFEACSRLSPHLAFGTISMRETYQAARRAHAQFATAGDGAFKLALDSFIGRLHWHCHFMQKLENETSIERRNLHPAYDGLRRDPEPDDPRLAAWIDGRTGFPFVDACMRALRETGWLNFRMRAMVMAFSSYHLWFHWRLPAQLLAARFTDFEAGIHYPQAQMQSGTTGVNTARIYNPVKQSQDQDPEGAFVRRWVPELAKLPTQFIHAPWEAPARALSAAGIELGADYPHRIVDHVAAGREAREKIYARRKGAAYRRTAAAIQDKHGSRRSGIAHRGQRSNATARSSDQLNLDFGPMGAGDHAP